MAVGEGFSGQSGLLAAVPAERRPLTEGQSVKYWSTTKNKWIVAIVKAVGKEGAVQLSVKPNVWVGRLEQAAKVLVEPAPTASPPPPESCPEERNGPVQLPRQADRNGPVHLPRQAAGRCAARQPDRSRELFSLFAEWDAKRQHDVSAAGLHAHVPEQTAAAMASSDKPKVCSDCALPQESARQLDSLKALLLEQPQRSMRKRVPSLIWRIFYGEIRAKAAGLCCLQGTAATRTHGAKSESSGSHSQGTTAAQLQEELAAALAEAETHLQRLCSEVQRRVDGSKAAETARASRGASLRARLHCIGQVHVMLADLERYRATYRVCDAPAALQRAERLYCSALEAFPQLGQAFNQRGLLAALRGEPVSAVLCGFRALLCNFPFPNSKENLAVWLTQAMDVPRREEDAAALFATDPRRCCIAAVCQFQHQLLFPEGQPENSSAVLPSLPFPDAAEVAEAQLRHVAGAVAAETSVEGAEWLLELVAVSVCAAVYHAYGGWPASSARSNDPFEYTASSTFEAAVASAKSLVGESSLSGEANRAWQWLLRLGSTLTQAAKEHEVESPLLVPLASFAQLCARLLPSLWVGSTAAPLRSAITRLPFLAAAATNGEDVSLMQYSLPEDRVVLGLVTVAEAGQLCGPSAPHREHASAEEDEGSQDDGSEDEVVLCSAVVHASPSKSRVRAAPESLRASVRCARLSQALDPSGPSSAVARKGVAHLPSMAGPPGLARPEASKACGSTSIPSLPAPGLDGSMASPVAAVGPVVFSIADEEDGCATPPVDFGFLDDDFTGDIPMMAHAPSPLSSFPVDGQEPQLLLGAAAFSGS